MLLKPSKILYYEDFIYYSEPLITNTSEEFIKYRLNNFSFS